MNAIKAEFVQIKPFKKQPIVQLIFEMPAEKAQEAIDILGWPQLGESVWCGIARLVPDGQFDEIDEILASADMDSRERPQ